MNNFHIVALFLAITLSACSSSKQEISSRTITPEERLDAQICIKGLAPLIKKIEEKNLSTSPVLGSSKTTSDVIAETTAEFYQETMERYQTAVLMVKWNELTNAIKVKNEKIYLYNDCSEYIVKDSLANYLAKNRIRVAYKYEEAAKNDMYASLTAMNKEIDSAQDDFIADYKKKAKRHWVTTGAGHIKVDTFEMNNGEVIYCKTSITDSGKAVDCS